MHRFRHRPRALVGELEPVAMLIGGNDVAFLQEAKDFLGLDVLGFASPVATPKSGSMKKS